MSITMASETPRLGLLGRIKSVLTRKPSKELTQLDVATQRLDRAADKIEAAAARLDPLGEIVEGLRAGPADRPRKKKKPRKTSKRPS